MIEVHKSCENCKAKDTYCPVYPGDAEKCVEYRPRMHWVDEILKPIKKGK